MTRKQNPDAEHKDDDRQGAARPGQDSADGTQEAQRRQSRDTREAESSGRRQQPAPRDRRQAASGDDHRPSHSGYAEMREPGRGTSAGASDDAGRSGSKDTGPSPRSTRTRDRED